MELSETKFNDCLFLNKGAPTYGSSPRKSYQTHGTSRLLTSLLKYGQTFDRFYASRFLYVDERLRS